MNSVSNNQVQKLLFDEMYEETTIEKYIDTEHGDLPGAVGKTTFFSSNTFRLSCRRFSEAAVQSNFIEVALRHGCSPINLPNIF